MLVGAWRAVRNTCYLDRLRVARVFIALCEDGGSSARLYYETARARGWSPAARSTVPTGVAVFRREIVPPIRRFAEQSDNIVHWTEFGRGGHFAAMEVPDLLTGDVREFFRPLR